MKVAGRMIFHGLNRRKQQIAFCMAMILYIIPVGIVGKENKVYAENQEAAAQTLEGLSHIDEEKLIKAQKADDLLKTAEGIFQWKKMQEGIAGEEFLLSGEMSESAGSSVSDWYALAMGRCGCQEDYETYAFAMKEQITKKYQTEEKLDANSATEWHRQILTLLAIGEDPTAIIDQEGNSINLVADGTYNRGKTKALGEQGLNAYIWALLALDSMNYQIPEGSADTRTSIITAILSGQNVDGGFSMTDGSSDVDMTAMALQALAPYYNQEPEYITAEKDNLPSAATVQDSVDRALKYLSQCQQKDGTMSNGSVKSAESTAQVIMALCCMDIDLSEDMRFVKEGNTLLDGLMLFRNTDGGFSHLLSEEDRDSNSLVGEQAACALVAYARFCLGENSIYDFTSDPTDTGDEQNTNGQKSNIVDLKQHVLLQEYRAFQKEIDEINEEIQTWLYPFENLGNKELKRAASIAERIETMPDYAKDRILEYEKVCKAARLYRTGNTSDIWILLSAVAAAGFAAVWAAVRYRKRKLREEDNWNEE